MDICKAPTTCYIYTAINVLIEAEIARVLYVHLI